MCHEQRTEQGEAGVERETWLQETAPEKQSDATTSKGMLASTG